MIYYAILVAISLIISILLSIKYILSPNYKIIFDRAKFEDKLDSVEKIHELYKSFKNSKIKEHQNILNAKMHSYLGTDKYDYRLIFKLIENRFTNIERIAKRIDDAWPILRVEYSDDDAKFKHWFSMHIVDKLRNWLFVIYTVLSFILIPIIVLGIQYKSINRWLAIATPIIILVMFLCVWAGSKFTTIFVLKKLIESENTIYQSKENI